MSEEQIRESKREITLSGLDLMFLVGSLSREITRMSDLIYLRRDNNLQEEELKQFRKEIDQLIELRRRLSDAYVKAREPHAEND